MKFLNHWPPPTLVIGDSDRKIQTLMIRTPDHPKIVGLVKHLNVQAPLDKVAEVTERFEEYPKVWEGVLSVKVESQDRNRWVTAWVRKAPAFFMPKLHYRMVYTVDRSQPGRVLYRQQLMDGNALNASDCLVVLEKRGENTTRISVANFFDPDAGPFRSVVEGVIWKKSLQNSVKDDVAFRAHVEHPDWDLDKLSEESDKAWDHDPIDPIEFTDAIHLD